MNGCTSLLQVCKLSVLVFYLVAVTALHEMLPCHYCVFYLVAVAALHEMLPCHYCVLATIVNVSVLPKGEWALLSAMTTTLRLESVVDYLHCFADSSFLKVCVMGGGACRYCRCINANVSNVRLVSVRLLVVL